MEIEEGLSIKNPDILFVIPPVLRFLGKSSESFPLGLGSMVSCLKANGISALIYNSDICKATRRKMWYWPARKQFEGIHTSFAKSWPRYDSAVKNKKNDGWREIRSVLEVTHPRIVGISSRVVDIPSSFALAQLAKEILPETRVIVGGPSAITCSDYLMKCRAIDCLVLGEGENTIVELAGFLLGRAKNKRLGDIDGICYRDAETGQTVRSNPRSLIANIDQIPFPDRESMFFVDEQQRIKRMNAFADVLTSRGCPYPCMFCCAHAAWGTKKPRLRSVENVIEELKILHRHYQQKFFIFWDDLFTYDRKRAIHLCRRIIEENLKISWLCLVRINTLDAELLEIMKEAGCIEIQIGIESGSNRILKLIKKSLTIEMIKSAVPLIKNSGIKWRIFLMIGFPTETEKEIAETIGLVDELNPDFVDLGIFAPYPGTPIHEELKAQGLLGDSFMKSDMYNPEINFTGTISKKVFRKIAMDGFALVDQHNERAYRS